MQPVFSEKPYAIRKRTAKQFGSGFQSDLLNANSGLPAPLSESSEIEVQISPAD